MEETIWIRFECGAGARWTANRQLTLNDNPAGKICNFSGCNCGTIVKKVGETNNRIVAYEWFRRPHVIRRCS